MSFGIVEILFLVSNVNIRHFSKIRLICQDSWTLFKKKPIVLEKLFAMSLNFYKSHSTGSSSEFIKRKWLVDNLGNMWQFGCRWLPSIAFGVLKSNKLVVLFSFSAPRLWIQRIHREDQTTDWCEPNMFVFQQNR